MANTITVKEIHDGLRNYTVDIRIVGDGSGDESATTLIDITNLANSPSEFHIEAIYSTLTGFSADLLWDATTDVSAFQCIEGESGVDFTQVGGPITNTAGAGKTGSLNITTVGLGSGDDGFIRIAGKKKY